MAFIFDKNLDSVLDTYEKWWEHKLDRPLMPVIVYGEPEGPPPDIKPGYNPRHGCNQAMFADTDVTPKDIVDCLDYSMSAHEFLSDAYPVINTSFSGPGIAAAFLGADIKTINGGNWFYGFKDKDIHELRFEFNPNNFWLNRMKEIIIEGKKRWGNSVIIGMPDLGGTLDVLASLRGSENLLMDLYDHPEEIKRLVKETGRLWKKFYDEIVALSGDKHTYTDWTNIPSRTSSYILQSDFVYMIGREMFDEFALPELNERCMELERPTYHLDGPGQLPHLASLLAIENLKMVQWVPGDGTIPVGDWGEVHCQIMDAGKLLFHCDNSPLCGWEKQLEGIINRRGSLKGVCISTKGFHVSNRDDGLRLMDKYLG
jgi:5-methyltetrahydrofolate--homocysteine methyltransferase